MGGAMTQAGKAGRQAGKKGERTANSNHDQPTSQPANQRTMRVAVHD